MGQTAPSSQPLYHTSTSKISLEPEEIFKTNHDDPAIANNQNNQNITKLCAIDFGTTHLSISFCDYVVEIKSDTVENCSYVFGELKRTSAYFLLQPKPGSEGDDDEDWICTHVGAAAINEYRKIRALSKHVKKQCCLFSNFKMSIYKIVKKDIKEHEGIISPICNIGGKRMFHIGFLFSKVLKYLADLSMTKMKMNDSTLNIENVKWILTVPAIWGKKGATIMINCFKKEWNYLDFEDRIECVLEPEMATIQAIAENPNIVIPVNKNVAVFDIGGGTSDLHIFTYNNLTKEISGSASSYGAAFGGENIDKEILEILQEKLTKEEVEDNLMSLRTKWEEVKQTMEYDPHNKEHLFFGSFFDFAPSTNNNSSKIDVLEKDVFVNRKCVYDIYQKWASKNAELILEKKKNTPIEMIILVGGMFESDVFYNIIRLDLLNSGEFQENQIIVTKNPKLAIIKGAILHGLKRKPLIVSRISSHTYGLRSVVNTSLLEDERKEKLKLEKYKNNIIMGLAKTGKEDCFLEDSIFIFIKKGESIPLNWEKQQGFYPNTPNKKADIWKILESDDQYPMLANECRVITTFEQTYPEEFTKLEWKNQGYKVRFNLTNTINVSVKYNFETEFKSIPQLAFDVE